MPAVARCLLLSLNILLLSLPAVLGPGAHPFLVATILVAIVNLALVALWDRLTPDADRRQTSDVRRHTSDFALQAVLAGIAGAIVLFAVTREWLYEILTFPHDSMRGDMLIVIQQGIRRLLQGNNPYAIFHIPWDATLPYGPVMWAPLVLPTLLHADIRFVTVLGYLFVPTACAIAAIDEAAHGRRAGALAWLAVPCALALSPEMRHFVSIGHTPVYWPLIALFAWLVARERWSGAAVAGGLLIVARTTMVSLAPVVLIAVWYRARPRTARVVLLLAASTLLPFLPFALWDFAALKFGLYGSYQSVIKGFVWTQTDWVQHTIGVTALLFSYGRRGAVQIVQVVVMLAVYVVSAIAIRHGHRPLPWMALALLAFSMTTLWPVTYVYFDVCLLLVSAAMADTRWLRTARPVLAWVTVLTVSLLVLAIAAWVIVPVNAVVDAGTASDRRFLYSGFSADERDGDITFAWIDGNRAEILVPRRSRRDATIDIACQPNFPTPDAAQQLSVVLNGSVIGTVNLVEGWQRVSFAAPGRTWQIGVNELTLFLSTAASPFESGLGPDRRRLSLGVDRLTVRTR